MKILKTSLLLSIAALFCSCEQQHNTLRETEKAEGWQLLFLFH
jgi:hypothetical protein